MVKVNLPIWLLWEPIKPPPDIVNPVLELEPGTWERWLYDGYYDDEYVNPDVVAKCEAYMDWCRAEQRRRFDAILEDEDAELANDQSEQAKKWRAFALSLAQWEFPKLLAIPVEFPDPPPQRKRAGRKNVDDAIFEAVTREWERAGGRISFAEACRRASKGGTWTERQFTSAKDRWYKANPTAERRRGRPKKVREA
jgi:hypothetical protein